MALFKVEGVVIRTRAIGEADRAVTVYTRERGKIRGVARGSRRPRSRLSGATQPFTYGRFLFFEGRSLDAISQAQPMDSLPNIKGDLVRMAHASVIAELVDRACEEGEPNEELFELLLAAMNEIEATGDPETLELVLIAFELRLVRVLGYGPELFRCVRCGRPLEPPGDERAAPHANAPSGAAQPQPPPRGDSEGRARPPVAPPPVLDVASGGLVCGACPERGQGEDSCRLKQGEDSYRLNWGGIMVMRRLLASGPREARTLRAPQAMRRAIEGAVRAFIEYRVESHTRSADFLDLLRRS